MSLRVTLTSHRVRRKAEGVQRAAGCRGVIRKAVRATAPVVLAAALLGPAGEAWAVHDPRPGPAIPPPSATHTAAPKPSRTTARAKTAGPLRPRPAPAVTPKVAVGVRPNEPRRPQRRHRYGRAPSLVPETSAPGTASPAPSQSAAQGPGDEGDSSDSGYGPRGALRVLPLGAGMALIGLGLGFLGIRMRRG